MVEIGPKYTPSLSTMTLLIIPQSPSPPSPKTQLTFFSIEKIMMPQSRALKSRPFKTHSSKSLVKKLGLVNLQQYFQLRGYYEEFMDMKEGFSESCKRELEKERKFWV
jgi:hypothetical protein